MCVPNVSVGFQCLSSLSLSKRPLRCDISSTEADALVGGGKLRFRIRLSSGSKAH